MKPFLSYMLEAAGLTALADLWQEAILAWAAREISPAHPDASAITLELALVRQRNTARARAMLHARIDASRAARAAARRVWTPIYRWL